TFVLWAPGFESACETLNGIVRRGRSPRVVRPDPRLWPSESSGTYRRPHHHDAEVSGKARPAAALERPLQTDNSRGALARATACTIPAPPLTADHAADAEDRSGTLWCGRTGPVRPELSRR